MNQPTPARVYGLPDVLNDMVGAQPLTVTWNWGDGSSDTMSSADEGGPDSPGSIWCQVEYELDESTDPPTYYPQDDFGYGCVSGIGHTYAEQGVFDLSITAEQPQPDGTVETSTSGVYPQLVTDLAKGGSLSGKGTVYAPPGSGGMYDVDFGGGLATFTVSAKRKSGTAATTALVTVSVPSMRPDWPQDQDVRGLEFRGTAAIAPLFVAKTKTGGEVWLRRVEGRVTNTAGDAGTAWASIHTIVTKGQPTLLRIKLVSTSAGYTYVDTGYRQYDDYVLDVDHDLLLLGAVKVG